MEEHGEYLPLYDYDDNYKSYEGYLENYNPDDYECDYWEDMLPDIDKMAEDFERSMEEREYLESGYDGYNSRMTVEELDRKLDEEFYC